MRLRRLAGLLGLGLMCLVGPAAGAEGRGGRPDVVVIMLDDLGYSDLGCFGGEIRTPHIDSLAQGGLRMTQFYNMARCCPTRASLMTGLYPHQVGLVVNGRSLTKDGATIAEMLRPSGYQTAMTGKWHLSQTPTLEQNHLDWINHQLDPGIPFGPLESYPVNRGFDRFYGIIWGVIDYFDPFSLVDGTTPVADVPDDYYITDAITEHSVEYIRAMAERDEPFFLYVAHCAPHWPLHALPEDIARYTDTYRDGWHALRESRYRRQVELGLFDPATHRLPELMGRGPDWDELDPQTRAWESSIMATHAAMVDRVDQGVGQILETLKETGRFDNTVILVLADNGASPERPNAPGYDRPSETRSGEPILYQGQITPGIETSYAGIGPWWANAANTPFRYWKKESFEGGCHTPLIVHWPAGLKPAPGSIDSTTGHVIDIVPTVLDLAGVERPETLDGHAQLPLEGVSLRPVLEGTNAEKPLHDVVYFEHEGGRAIRRGDWKLVALNRGDWELYNLAVDATEIDNLADQQPERVRELSRQWAEWAERVGAPVPSQVSNAGEGSRPRGNRRRPGTR